MSFKFEDNDVSSDIEMAKKRKFDCVGLSKWICRHGRTLTDGIARLKMNEFDNANNQALSNTTLPCLNKGS